jgi:hypothetical protein
MKRKNDMRRLIISSLMVLGLACATQPLVAADVTQTGTYTYTSVKQINGRVTSYTMEFDAAEYERLKANAAKSAAVYARRMSTQHYKRRCGLTTQAANATSIAQDGVRNLAATKQIGVNNSAGILQQGNANAAFTVQGGQNHDASTSQSGDYNIALVVQVCR